MKEDTIIKEFFEDEVKMMNTPPIPDFAKSGKKKKISWDSLLIAACILTSLVVIMVPAAYDNAIRRSYVPISKYEAFKEEIPRVIFDASLYFKNR